MLFRFTLCLSLYLMSNFAYGWAPEAVEAAEAWKRGINGEGVVVALLDTGVEINHPQLVNQIHYNDGEMGLDSFGRDKRNNGIDDDGNGFVDDYAGWDFAHNTGIVIDNANYGTMLAGVIAAEHNDINYDPTKVQGLAPKAKILPIKFINNNNGANNNHIIRGIDYAVARGAKIINMGWTLSRDFPAMRQKVRELMDQGILVVASAGDNSRDIDVFPTYPATYGFGNMITVGAHTSLQNKTANFTNFGQNTVQLMAPGVGIFTTSTDRKSASRSGSGMASSFISGTAALLWSHRPQATVYDIVDSIVAGTIRENEYSGICWSEGRLSVKGAIDYLETIYPPEPDL